MDLCPFSGRNNPALQGEMIKGATQPLTYNAVVFETMCAPISDTGWGHSWRTKVQESISAGAVGGAVGLYSVSHNELQSVRRYLRALRFDDKLTHQQQVESGNQGAVVHEMFHIFPTNCRSSYRCGPTVTTDKQLLTFHGNCRFRVHIPTKPGKYDMKVWIMADSETFYRGDLQLYSGHVGSQQECRSGITHTSGIVDKHCKHRTKHNH